ncbi:two-component sensor histidine kinase [Streptomyces spectabilis]|uniref:histidine kinase n=1 Tax=Streptomyces spectabilis TaxID=68270 RepID=A0A7W8ANL9_STRST|nr:histidine kinase [Streptomyces spectabilis]MBB5101657.1 signal transduction histidine kinase [Streptomyces spectabilis]MCI3900839.1 histidine kinase [Streptomyces spectabilis]GGV12781.1 two-component sensor histidine kinase [Streptomyces spectabilis]
MSERLTALRARWPRRLPPYVVDLVILGCAVIDLGFTTDFYHETPGTLTAAAVACAALLFRRRFPLAVVLLTLPASVVVELTVPPFAALFTLADRTRDRRLLAVCAILSAAASAFPWPPGSLTSDDQTWTLIYFVYTLTTAAAPVLLGQLTQARRDLSRRLAEIEEAREHERALHAQAVLAQERAQLAREMHDVVSHQVSLIAVRAGAWQVAAKDTDSRDAARTIRALSVNTLDELRHMVTLLRASGGRATELTPQPTLADLRALVGSSGIEAELTGALPPDIATPAQRTLYRTVQEALTNVRKHAPGARADVHLWDDGEEFGVTVTNSPPTRPSLPLPGSQQGLIGLRERAELLHGTFHAGPTADGGYRIRLGVPHAGG